MSRGLTSLVALTLLVVIEGVIHAHTPIYVDVASLAVAYFALERPILNGAAASLFAGWLMDMTASVPLGLYSGAAVLAFIAVRAVLSKLPWSGAIFAAMVGLATTALVPLIAVAIDGLLGAGAMSVVGALPAAPSLALSALLLCYPVHRLLARIDERLGRSDEDFVLQ